MTEKRANEIFKTKYPNGEICRKNSTSAGYKYWVVFDTSKVNHKAYYYSETSYAQLLNRLGFKVAYKHDLVGAEKLLSDYEQRLSDAKEGKFRPFTFAFVERNEENEKAAIEKIQKQVDEYKELVRYYKEDCIIDN